VKRLPNYDISEAKFIIHSTAATLQRTMSSRSPVSWSWCLHRPVPENTGWRCSHSKTLAVLACPCIIWTRYCTQYQCDV